LRDKNATDVGIDATSTDDEIYAAMAANPKIIQRPILIKGKKAALGRPIETMLELK